MALVGFPRQLPRFSNISPSWKFQTLPLFNQNSGNLECLPCPVQEDTGEP